MIKRFLRIPWKHVLRLPIRFKIDLVACWFLWVLGKIFIESARFFCETGHLLADIRLKILEKYERKP